MKPYDADTIVAMATPPGYGGVAIVRVSGELAPVILEKVTGKISTPRYAEYLSFKTLDDEVIDLGIVLYFPKPHSFTGEHVVEFHGHGGPVVQSLLIEQIIAHGARLAEPGEFSKRAFLNDKIDLIQAEAIADLINSASTQAAKSAMRSLQGGFSMEIEKLVQKVLNLRIYVEAAIDFPEEEVDFLSDGVIEGQLSDIQRLLNTILIDAKQGALLREGINVVIAGKPNAGKSSLLNALSGKDSAIVTEVPGTTRDILKEYIAIEGVPMHLYDTAGLRDSDDVVEVEGIKRAKNQIALADLVLFVFDGTEVPSRDINTLLKKYEQNFLKENQHLIIVCNKIDKTGESAEVKKEGNIPLIQLSAKTHLGLLLLKQQIIKTIGLIPEMTGGFIARERHLVALNKAKTSLDTAILQFTMTKAGELLAEDLREIQAFLGCITGQVHSDDLLGMIFSSFCIGK